MTFRVPSLPIVPESKLYGIPRVVHQIWVGSPPPAWVHALWEEWDAYAEKEHFEMRRWTSSALRSSVSARVALQYDLSPVQLADLLRIELLSLQGGLYMDSDTLPIRSLAGFVGARVGWLAHGQAWTKKGDPTVSNAMMGMPVGTVFMSDLFEHAVRAIQRGVKDTFSIAGPAAYRRLLDKTPAPGVVVAPPEAFPAFRAKHKAAEEKLGRRMNQVELQTLYPEAAVVHLSAESWVPGKIEKRSLDA